MAMKALQMFSILFLLFSASLVFPSAEGLRSLEESKAAIGYKPLPANRPLTPAGRPYTRPCRSKVNCPGPSEAKP